MVSPEVVGIGSEYFVVYFRVYIDYVRPVYHYIAATVTVVYLAQRFITNCLCRGYLILYYPICKFQSLFSFWIACDIPNIEVDTKKQVARHNQPNAYFEVLLMISCNNIVFTCLLYTSPSPRDS